MNKNKINIENLISELNNAQQEAVKKPIDYCTKIVAGAGTGKTKIISKRFTKLVMDMLEQGIETPQNKILVITFTDKAANEMKDRILKELESNNIKSTNIIDESLWISTFHSFCMRILKKHAIEIGFSPSFKMADETKLKQIYDNIIKSIKYNELEHIENIHKILNDVGLDINDLSIDSINKINAIAPIESIFEDIYQTIKKIKALGIDAKEFLEKTIHSIELYTEAIEKTPFKFDSKEDYASAWHTHFTKYRDDSCEIETKIFDDIAKEKVLLNKFGKRKAIEYGMGEGFPENIAEITKLEKNLTKIICGIYALYQNELQKNNLADFDDLINKTIQIFKENKQIKDYYQNYFKHIIVDEFQDTNGAQLELIELLLNSKNPNLTYVGDRKQSIYGFRYAQMENLEVLFDKIQKKYNQSYTPINLSTNYRSTPDVLNAVNYITKEQLGLASETLQANPHREFVTSPKSVKVSVIENFENSYEHKVFEARYIANEINNIKKQENCDYKDFAILVKSHSQADIVEKELKKQGIPSIKKVNTGFFKSRIVKNTISAFKLIHNLYDEQAFYRLLNVVMTDSEIYEFKKNIDKNLLETLNFDELKKLNLVQKFILLKDKDKNKIAKNLIDNVIDIRKSKNELSLTQIFEKINKHFQLDNTQTQSQKDIECTQEETTISNLQMKNFEKEQALVNLKTLEIIIDDFSQNENYSSIKLLLEYLEKAAEDKNFELPTIYPQSIDAVQILTIHASKGLEYKYVFLLSITTATKPSDKSNIIFDMQYGNKPGFGLIIKNYKEKLTPKACIYNHIWKKPREFNENLRLFYVAVTRAEKHLDVLSFEQYKSIKPAEYIEELKEYLI